MEIEQDDFILSDAEIAAGLAAFPSTSLGLKAPESLSGGRAAAAGLYDGLDGAQQEKLKGAIRTLAGPARLARFHYTVSDEAVVRSDLAWGAGGDGAIVALTASGGRRRISVRSEAALSLLLAQALAADDRLEKADMSLSLSTAAILVLLAIAEHFKLLRLHAVAAHVEPLLVFKQEEVAARLAEADTEDFRWPLLFFAKVMPVSLPLALTAEDVALAIEELMLAELIAPSDETGEARIYEPTEVGEWVFDNLLHDVSKAAVGISEYREDGEVGHEAVLLVRSAFNLFLFDLSGQEGVFASLSREGLEALSKALFSAAAVAVPAGARAVPQTPQAGIRQPSQAAAVCAACGTALSPGQKFCNKCGAKAEQPRNQFCTKCGTPLPPGAKFCTKCGEETE